MVGQGLWASLNSTAVGSHLSGVSVCPPSCHAEGWGLGAPVGNTHEAVPCLRSWGAWPQLTPKRHLSVPSLPAFPALQLPRGTRKLVWCHLCLADRRAHWLCVPFVAVCHLPSISCFD